MFIVAAPAANDCSISGTFGCAESAAPSAITSGAANRLLPTMRMRRTRFVRRAGAGEVDQHVAEWAARVAANRHEAPGTQIAVIRCAQAASEDQVEFGIAPDRARSAAIAIDATAGLRAPPEHSGRRRWQVCRRWVLVFDFGAGDV